MIILERHHSETTAVLRFHQQDGPNAFDAKTAKELLKICASLKKNPPRALAWISGHSQFYCTGGDLRAQIQSSKLKSTLKDHLTIRKALEHLDQIPCPKATLVDGDCYGGGMEILSCFHHVVATPRALFGFWQRKMGLSFGWAGGSRLLRRVSEGRLRQILLEQPTLSAWQARELGLVDQLCDISQGTHAIQQWLKSQSSFGWATARALPGWTPKTEGQIFRALYGGEEHTSVLKQLSHKKKKR